MPETQEMVGAVFGDILARMAFMFVDEAPAASLAPPAGGAVGATMEFAGDRRGALTLAAATNLCAALAANVLGCEADEAPAREGAVDSLQELLNVTCGHVVTAVAGDAAVVDLAAPTSGPLAPAAWRALAADPATLGFAVEGHSVLLRLELRA